MIFSCHSEEPRVVLTGHVRPVLCLFTCHQSHKFIINYGHIIFKKVNSFELFFLTFATLCQFSSSTHQQSDFITTEARCSFLFQLSWPSFQDRKLLFDNCTTLHIPSHLVRRFRDVSAEAKGKKERKKNKYVCAVSLPSAWVAQGPLSLSLLRLTTITLVTYHN